MWYIFEDSSNLPSNTYYQAWLSRQGISWAIDNENTQVHDMSKGLGSKIYLQSFS